MWYLPIIFNTTRRDPQRSNTEPRWTKISIGRCLIFAGRCVKRFLDVWWKLQEAVKHLKTFKDDQRHQRRLSLHTKPNLLARSPEPANGFSFDQHWTSSIDSDGDIRGPCILIPYALEWGVSKSLDVDFHLIQPRTTSLPKLMFR